MRLSEIIITVLSLLFVMLIVSIHIVQTVYENVLPNTFLYHKNLSATPINTLDTTLQNVLHQPVRLKLQNRVYETTYNQLGISFDKQQVIQDITAKNSQPFPHNIQQLLTSIIQKTTLTPTVIFTNTYHTYIDATIFNLTALEDATHTDNDLKSITHTTYEKRYRINKSSLTDEIHDTFGAENVLLEPQLIPEESSKSQEVYETNQKLQTLFSSTLTITTESATPGGTIQLSGDDIKALTIIQQEADGTISFGIDTATYEQNIQPLIDSLQLYDDQILNHNYVKSELIQAITVQFYDQSDQTITLLTSLGPNTQGNIAEKYIEIDISQQRMYLFEHGEEVGMYRVSTGKYLPTPVGEFTILNKTPSGAFSDIYNVYMPYWMAFYFDEAFYGIHELPYYWLNGEKIQRPSENIGEPSTGGCVALDVGDAQKVYDFGELGMKVVVFD